MNGTLLCFTSFFFAGEDNDSWSCFSNRDAICHLMACIFARLLLSIFFLIENSKECAVFPLISWKSSTLGFIIEYEWQKKGLIRKIRQKINKQTRHQLIQQEEKKRHSIACRWFLKKRKTVLSLHQCPCFQSSKLIYEVRHGIEHSIKQRMIQSFFSPFD